MLLLKCSVTFLLLIMICSVLCENKYSRDANEKSDKKDKEAVDFRTLERPFRMHKLNLVWIKAQQRLTQPKLKSLYSDLMIHDKEEITFKRVKSEGGDKEGMKEAELRRKLTTILNVYGLREHFEDHGRSKEHPAANSALDDHINKSLFKDKKLNQLWLKAETAGFTSAELAALKEEFTHHQDKVDQYYDLLYNLDNVKADDYKNALSDDEVAQLNEVGAAEEPESNELPTRQYMDRANLVRVKHRGLRDNLDRLQRITARGPNNKEFIEPKVQGLWKMAVASNFTTEELASLKVELHHYENRLLKLRHLHADHVSNVDKHHAKVAATGDKNDLFHEQQQMIKKHSRKVEKMHSDLESRIRERHNEL